MEILAPTTRIDWFRILDDVRREGFSLYEVAYYTSIPKSTLLGYKNAGHEPDHSTGDVILRFWSQVTLRNQGDAPRIPRMPSAAKLRR